jgi:hypothetical protein
MWSDFLWWRDFNNVNVSVIFICSWSVKLHVFLYWNNLKQVIASWLIRLFAKRPNSLQMQPEHLKFNWTTLFVVVAMHPALHARWVRAVFGLISLGWLQLAGFVLALCPFDEILFMYTMYSIFSLLDSLSYDNSMLLGILNLAYWAASVSMTDTANIRCYWKKFPQTFTDFYGKR